MEYEVQVYNITRGRMKLRAAMDPIMAEQEDAEHVEETLNSLEYRIAGLASTYYQ